MSVDVLLVNALVYVATLCVAILRFRRLNLYVLVWSAYTVVAVMGYYAVKMKWHYMYDPDLGYKVSFFPYVMAYLSVLFITSPFYRIDENKFDFSTLNIPIIGKIARFFILVFSVETVLRVYAAYVISKTIGFGGAYMMAHEGESFVIFTSPVITTFLKFTHFTTPIVFPLYVVFFLSKMIKHEGVWWKNLLCASLVFLPDILSAIAGGSKGALFFSAFSILFYFLLFRPLLSKKIQRKFFLIVALAGLCLILYVVVITASRYEVATGKESSALQQESTIVRYLGEAFPNLGGFYYDKVLNHTDGRRFFPEFFSDNPERYYKGKGIDAKFLYWTPITGVPMPMFKTFWGDWYIEFGVFGSVIAIFSMVLIFRQICLKKYYVVSRLPLVYFYYMNIVIRGCFTGNGLEGTMKHKIFIFLLLELLLLDSLVVKKKLTSGRGF